uniref:Malate dehydrogenase, cytoplasmic n=1 Tax=Ciona savignyi TaxID=51511 RepID=H2Z4K0_CIOSA
MGGFNEFMEYAECYYGVTSNMMTDLMLKIKAENVSTKAMDIEKEKEFQSLSKPIHICIVNGTNPVAYHLIPHLANGKIFGSEVEISIRLLDKPTAQVSLQGIQMEIEDLAYPLVRKIEVYENSRAAFQNASVIIFLETDAKDELTHLELLLQNHETYKRYAEEINEVALSNVKIILSGSGTVNFNSHVLVEYGKNINKQNIVAMSKLQERRAQASLARKMQVSTAGVTNVVVWGNCANNAPKSSYYIDVISAVVRKYDGAIWGPDWYSRALSELVYDKKWLTGDFVEEHATHNSELMNGLRHHSSLSEAASLSCLLHDWIQGVESENVYSLGVESEGWYGVSGCVFSMPVRFKDGSYQVVWDLELSDETKEKIKKIEVELKKDLRVAFKVEDHLENEVFSEDATLISSMMNQTESPSKTPGEKLEVIREEDSEEQQEKTE